MSREENKALFRRMIEDLWNKGSLDAADALFTADHSSPNAPGLPPGPEGTKIIARAFLTAFPDLHITIEDLVASGDRVCGRLRERGTQRGEFNGMAPTGKPVDFQEIAIIRVADGKIAESWYQVDMLGVLQQLGAMPAFGAAATQPVTA